MSTEKNLEKDTKALRIGNVSNLLSCHFCNGKVIESINKAGNLAEALCTNCGAKWGACNSVFKYRFEFWNERDG